MDNRAITKYKLLIKVCDQKECAKYNPFGLCYVDDCMSCPNSRVKITREDGVVMRDDLKTIKILPEKIKYGLIEECSKEMVLDFLKKCMILNFQNYKNGI